MIHHKIQEAIFRVVAAILHLGNINFAKGKEIDSSVIKDEKSRFHLNMTAELLRYISLIFLYSKCLSCIVLMIVTCRHIFLLINQNHAIGVMPRAWKMPSSNVSWLPLKRLSQELLTLRMQLPAGMLLPKHYILAYLTGI